MPKLPFARPALDADEERKIRKPAGARHAPRGGHRHPPLSGAPDHGYRTGALAAHPLVDHLHRSGLRPIKAEVIGLYTRPPPGTTVICADELGPVTPRTFPPAPAWSPVGHRIKDRLEYSRGTDRTWAYGGLRIHDGTELTFCAPSRDSDGWIHLLIRIATAIDRLAPRSR
ncbi:hypothetical protein [Streptosporangium roseum]|uniref:Uncharacterized protein n=1 Tax=Streptosporangium roseum (strain ATCC 12428 / DSM 43021 / JCM 3005 / KCTC 9067 / NCIMB 10171 / NRRL 2505 / NI 9100) TaxID=479432 RepID=D2B576_STRRD|nr:hypothetical protein [Streptosporangium roseum]ACZ87600.1 hypothetical protein Sros_4768 [Streptosporangium roseum DSM 43021]